ncbi:uncharacterized protein V6R79_017072 [Siganus canaliculatus]
MFSVALMLLLAAGSCVNGINLIQPDSMVVQPGQSLTITCQVSGYSLTDNSYATGWIRQREGKAMDWISHQWGGGDFYQNNALKNKFSYSRDTSAGTVTLNGQNLQTEDTAVYYCVHLLCYTAFDYWGKGTTVTVSSATASGPTVFPLIECSSGDTVTLGCFATGFSPSALTYTWTKSGTALTDSIQYPPTQKGNTYSGISQLIVRKQDWTREQPIKCAVSHSNGNGQVTFGPPRVHYQLPEINVLASSYEENDAVQQFSCFAKDFSPNKYEIKWLKNNVDISSRVRPVETPTSSRKDANDTTLYSVASFLTVESTEWKEGTTFTCLFKGKGEKVDTYTNSSVICKAPEAGPEAIDCPEADLNFKITGPQLEDLFLNHKAKIVCKVQVNKGSLERIWWEDKDGKEQLASSPATKENGNTYSLTLDITYSEWSNGIQRYCAAETSDSLEPQKVLFERNVGGELLRPSVFMLPPVEHINKETVTLTCYVKDFFPKEVYVSWLEDDDELNSDFHTTNPIQSGGTFYAYGHLEVSRKKWNDGKVFSCAVYHEYMANSTKTIIRSIGHSAHEKTNVVNLSMNIPGTCKGQ